ncbi:MAG: DUF2029 domain-containing protein [Chloroflexi bacterium]|nr:DUF2029 domain-containing protein [Chloroflexota bacterium]
MLGHSTPNSGARPIPSETAGMDFTPLYALAVGLLAVANAILFPLWTGFAGGAAPKASADIILWHLALALVNAVALLWLLRSMPRERGVPLVVLLLLATFTRLAYLAVRVSQSANVVDPDVHLFFRYAQEFAGGRYPTMEYPQGALLLYSIAYVLSSGDAARFALALPLFNLGFDLVAIASFVWIGKVWGSRDNASLLALLYAVSPFTLVLWYGKYDVVPAALLALGLSLFLARRYYFSSLALAIGFLAKWIPGIALAFLVVHLVRSGQRRQALGFAAVAGIAISLPLLATWMVAPDKLLDPYRFHSERGMMGESGLYIPVHFLEPTARIAPGTAPWTGVESNLIDGDLATRLQLAGVGLALVLAVAVRPRRAAAVALACVGVALFIILNRVFSPQYVLLLAVAYIVGGIALRLSRRVALAAILAILFLTFLNYLVWPLWAAFWVEASTIFFALNLVVTLALTYGAIRAEDPGYVDSHRAQNNQARGG